LDVATEQGYEEVFIKTSKDAHFQVFAFFRKSWADRLGVLRRADNITVFGRIQDVSTLVLFLEECEIVGDHSDETQKTVAAKHDAKHDYKIQRLKELIKQATEIRVDGSVGLDSPSFMATVTHRSHAERFLKSYFGESDVKRFKKEGLPVLEKLLKDLLES
jgi:hypothetical protein